MSLDLPRLRTSSSVRGLGKPADPGSDDEAGKVLPPEALQSPVPSDPLRRPTGHRASAPRANGGSSGPSSGAGGSAVGGKAATSAAAAATSAASSAAAAGPTGAAAGEVDGYSLCTAQDDVAASLPWLFPLSHRGAVLLVFFTAVLAFANSSFGELALDDNPAIKYNPDVRPTTPLWDLFGHDYWGKPLGDPMSHKSYRPLVVITFRLQYLFHEQNPIPYHLLNVLLHALVSAQVVGLAYTLFRAPSLALLCGLAFATHPVHADAVSSIVGRAELMGAMFYIAGIAAYVAAIERSAGFGGSGPGAAPSSSSPLPSSASLVDRVAYALSSAAGTRLGPTAQLWMALCAAACGMLSKEQAVTVVGVYFALEIILFFLAPASTVLLPPGVANDVRSPPRGAALSPASYLLWLAARSRERRWGRVLTTLGFFLSLMVFRLWVMQGPPLVFKETDNALIFEPSRLTRTLTLLYLPLRHFLILLWPWQLTCDYTGMPNVSTVTDPRLIQGVAFLLAVVGSGVALLLFLADLRRAAQAALAASSSAVSSLSSSAAAAATDSSSAAAALLSSPPAQHPTHGLSSLYRSPHLPGAFPSEALSNALLALLSLVLLGIPFVPSSQLFFWVGFLVAERVLYIPSIGFVFAVATFVRVVAFTPPFAYKVVGAAAANGDVDGAVDVDDVEVVAYRRVDVPAVASSATASATASAAAQRRRGVVRASRPPSSCLLPLTLIVPLAVLLLLGGLRCVSRGHDWRSEPSLWKADVVTNPLSARLHANACNTLWRTMAPEAEGHCRKAIELAPTYYIGYENLGRLLMDTRRYAEAERVLEKAMTLDPPNPSFPLVNLAISRAELNKMDSAIETFKKAVKLEPDDAQAWMNLGSILHRVGRHQEAYEALLTSAKKDQYQAKTHKNLAIVCHSMGRLDDSLMFLRNAIQLTPNDPEIKTMISTVEQQKRGGGGGGGHQTKQQGKSQGRK